MGVACEAISSPDWADHSCHGARVPDMPVGDRRVSQRYRLGDQSHYARTGRTERRSNVIVGPS
jgi:hypothetical protein